MSQIRIGTSGWAYKHWREKFYESGVESAEYLRFYGREFDTAEINYSFYKLPTPQNYFDWAGEVDDDFIFAVKGSRYLTHMKKLKEPEQPWSLICDTAGCLGPKLGPILMQFPARWLKNIERLSEFLECVDNHPACAHAKTRIAFEFRDESWFCKEVYNLLEKYGAALCIADSLEFVRKDVITADFTYFRYHGRMPIYAASYSSQQLKIEARKMQKLADEGIDIFAYFNNDGNAHAIKNVRSIKQLLGI